jgi:threonine/homoserine/homoserine lactone efflux protein
MFPVVTHYDLVVILAVSFAIQLGGLIFIAWLAWKGPRDMAALIRDSRRESERLTRAVAGLVAQESEKIRSMFPEGGRS